MRNLGGHLPATSLPLLSLSKFLTIFYFICNGVWAVYSILYRHRLITIHYFLITLTFFLFFSQFVWFLDLRYFHAHGSFLAGLQFIFLLLQSLAILSFQCLLLLISWGSFSCVWLIYRLGITREAVGEHICKLFGFFLISLPLLFIQEKTDVLNDSVLSARCICGCIQNILFISWFFVNIQSLKSELESKHQHKKLELVGQFNQILVFSLVFIVVSISVWVYQLVSYNRDRYWQQWCCTD